MGNCLDKAMSDEEDIVNSSEDSQSIANSNNQLNTNLLSTQQQQQQQQQRRSHRHRHHPHHAHHSNRSHSGSLPISQRVLNNSNFLQAFSLPTSTNRFIPSATNSIELSSSLQQQFNQTGSNQVYYLAPNVQRTADQLTEEDQIKLLKRMALIQQLPCGLFDDTKKIKECVICMIDFSVNDKIKYLPCMHTFHTECIDSWLVRSLYCPSCMEPVDAGLLSAFDSEQ